MFKISYHNVTLKGQSSESRDPAVTQWLLIILLADDYERNSMIYGYNFPHPAWKGRSHAR